MHYRQETNSNALQPGKGEDTHYNCQNFLVGFVNVSRQMTSVVAAEWGVGTPGSLPASHVAANDGGLLPRQVLARSEVT